MSVLKPLKDLKLLQRTIEGYEKSLKIIDSIEGLLAKDIFNTYLCSLISPYPFFQLQAMPSYPPLESGVLQLTLQPQA